MTIRNDEYISGDEQQQSILKQFDRCCDDGEGDITCSSCKQEIGQYYDAAWRYIEANKCPMCDCNLDFDDSPANFEWCDNCPHHSTCDAWGDCEDQRERENYEDQQVHWCMDQRWAIENEIASVW